MGIRVGQINLAEAPAERKLKVVQVNAGSDIKKHLSVLGIHIDDILVKQTWAKWGPILVSNESNGYSKVAIGRGLADKIMVEY